MGMLLTPSDIAALRRALNITQQELGDLLGVTEATVSRWESTDPAKRRKPSYDMLFKLSELAEKVGKRKLTAAAS